jgi:cell shape-determining protein MreC
MIRISLIIALVAALAVGALNVFVVKDKINTLVTDRNTNRDGWHATQAALSKTNAILVKTENTLKQTQQDLADTQSERDKAVAAAAAQNKRANDLSDKLVKATQERDDAQNQLASYKTTGFTPEQVAKLGRTLKDAQDAIEAGNLEKAVLQKSIARLETRLKKYEGPETDIVLRADLTGKIVAVDPKWDFVVLNIGDDQGVKENSELLVSRDGKLVAKVIVSKLEKNRCIANVIPGWKLGEVFEGDQVSPAHPAS